MSAALVAGNHSLLGRWLSSTNSNDTNLGEVKRGELVQRVTVAGMLMPLRRAIIAPPYSGYVKKIFVTLGERVTAGMPLVSVVQSLRGGEEVYPMLAPFDGEVVQVLKTEGEYVETGKDGNAIARVDDLTKLIVTSDVPETDVAKIRRGGEALIKAMAVPKHAYHGIIRDIAIAAKEKGNWNRAGDPVEFNVRIEVLDKDRDLRPGMSCLVDIITEKRTNVLLLPHEYVQKKDEVFFVTLADGTKRTVRVGLRNESAFEILDGLIQGDRVQMVDFAALPDKHS